MLKQLLNDGKYFDTVKRLYGGLTNEIYCVKKDDKVMIARIYNKNNYIVNRISEIDRLKMLNEYDIQPKIIETFSDGRLESIIIGITMDKLIFNCVGYDYLNIPPIIKKLHNKIPTIKSSIYDDLTCVKNINRYYSIILESDKLSYIYKSIITNNSVNKDYVLKNIKSNNNKSKDNYLNLLKQSTETNHSNLAKFIRKYAKSRLNQSLCMSHNDIHFGNIIYNNTQYHLIDYEYSGYNSFEYDIANFINELTLYGYNLTLYDRIRIYLKYDKSILTKYNYEVLDKMVIESCLMSNILWGLWAIVMSDIKSSDNKYADNKYADNKYADNKYADTKYADNNLSKSTNTSISTSYTNDFDYIEHAIMRFKMIENIKLIYL